jgi:hypothetical protein
MNIINASVNDNSNLDAQNGAHRLAHDADAKTNANIRG